MQKNLCKNRPACPLIQQDYTLTSATYIQMHIIFKFLKCLSYEKTESQKNIRWISGFWTPKSQFSGFKIFVVVNFMNKNAFFAAEPVTGKQLTHEHTTISPGNVTHNDTHLYIKSTQLLKSKLWYNVKQFF